MSDQIYINSEAVRKVIEDFKNRQYGIIKPDHLNFAARYIKSIISVIGGFDSLTDNQLMSIGFAPRAFNGIKMLLIPGWLWDIIPDGTQLISIDSRLLIKGQDKFDDDDRNGYMAYGIGPID